MGLTFELADYALRDAGGLLELLLGQLLSLTRRAKVNRFHERENNLYRLSCQEYFNKIGAVLVSHMGSYTYGDNPNAIVSSVIDLMAVRQRLIDERGERGWTQDDVADRAGVRQGQVSRLEDLSQALPDLAARVLFRVIEHGFGLTLSSFLAQFEGLQTKAGTSKVQTSPAEQDGYVPSVDASSSTLIDREAKAIMRAAKRSERQRKNTIGKSAKPGVRAKNRKPSRRSA